MQIVYDIVAFLGNAICAWLVIGTLVGAVLVGADEVETFLRRRKEPKRERRG